VTFSTGSPTAQEHQAGIMDESSRRTAADHQTRRNLAPFSRHRRACLDGIDVARASSVISSRRLCLLFASLAALTVGCQGKGELAGASRSTVPVQVAPMQAVPIQPAPAVAVQAAPTSMPMFAMQPAPVGEQALDTNVKPAAGKVVLTTHNLKTQKVRTVSDEKLPKWVPSKGRLTVVDSSDLAENLGLVPKGATKKADERISVADKLSEESAARASTGAKTDSMQPGVSWSFSAGRVRSRR
jgi:hypothetical protein